MDVPAEITRRATRLATPAQAQDKIKQRAAERPAVEQQRAELARVKMERDILKKRRRTLQGNLCEVRLDRQPQGAVARLCGL